MSFSNPMRLRGARSRTWAAVAVRSLVLAAFALLLGGEAFGADEAERLERAMNKYGSTQIEPAALLITLTMGIAVLALPRRMAALPIVFTAVFVPVAQRVVIASLDFNMVRILLLFALVRVLAKGEYRWIRINTMDQLVLGLILVSSLAYIGLNGTFGAVVNRAGNAFDTLGVYFFSRSVVRTREDVLAVVRYLEVAAVGLAAFMSVEFTTGRNLFHFLGGVPDFTPMRDGRFRCQGAFNHPILAGAFGATVLPLAIADLLSAKHAGRSRLLPLVGIGGAVGAALLAVSSGPLIALLAGLVSWAFWPIRTRMRFVRWTIATALVLLELVTKHPIWHLVVYLRFTASSSAYQRYRLMQAAVDHFGEWWLLGTRSTLHWGHFMHDITNYYILWGVRGGFASLAIFVTLIGFAFAHIGRAVARSAVDAALTAKEREGWAIFLFGLGCALMSHAMVFLSVSYYGQMLVLWVLFLSLAGGLPQIVRAGAPAARRVSPQPIVPVPPEAVGLPSARLGLLLERPDERR